MLNMSLNLGRPSWTAHTPPAHRAWTCNRQKKKKKENFRLQIIKKHNFVCILPGTCTHVLRIALSARFLSRSTNLSIRESSHTWSILIEFEETGGSFQVPRQYGAQEHELHTDQHGAQGHVHKLGCQVYKNLAKAVKTSCEIENEWNGLKKWVKTLFILQKRLFIPPEFLVKDVVDKSVGSEFSHVVRWAVFIQCLQLGLALVEFRMVPLITVEMWV